MLNDLNYFKESVSVIFRVLIPCYVTIKKLLRSLGLMILIKPLGFGIIFLIVVKVFLSRSSIENNYLTKRNSSLNFLISKTSYVVSLCYLKLKDSISNSTKFPFVFNAKPR